MGRKIDKQIEDAWKEERQADVDGNRALKLQRRTERRVLQRSKKEQVEIGDLTATPDARKPPKPARTPKPKGKARAKGKTSKK